MLRRAYRAGHVFVFILPVGCSHFLRERRRKRRCWVGRGEVNRGNSYNIITVSPSSAIREPASCSDGSSLLVSPGVFSIFVQSQPYFSFNTLRFRFAEVLPLNKRPAHCVLWQTQRRVCQSYCWHKSSRRSKQQSGSETPPRNKVSRRCTCPAARLASARDAQCDFHRRLCW